MKKLLKQTTCFLLACLLFAGVLIAHPATAKAEENDNYTSLYTSSWETSIANTAKTYSFTTKSTGRLYVDLYFAQPTSFSYEITNASGNTVSSGSVFDTDEDWYPMTNGETTLYVNGPYYPRPTVGDFNLSITTAVDSTYLLDVYQGSEIATISNSSMTITAGFTDTLKVTNASGKITWKSSNAKVATVNSKGVVTGKKKGNCKVTATTEDGQKLECKIKIRENAYKDTKYTNADATSGEVTAYVYKATFDSNGNLVCKVRLINNKYNTVTDLVNFKLTVSNDKQKKVFSYNVGSKSINVPGYKYKDFTVTIPKASVKKCDLAKGSFSCTGSFRYIK